MVKKRANRKSNRQFRRRFTDRADPPAVNTHPWYSMVCFFKHDDVTTNFTLNYASFNSYFTEMYGINNHDIEIKINRIRCWGPVARGASQANSSDLGMEVYSIIDLAETSSGQSEPLYIKIDYAAVDKRSHLAYRLPSAHRQTVVSSGTNQPFAFFNGCELVYVNIKWRFHRTNTTMRAKWLAEQLRLHASTTTPAEYQSGEETDTSLSE